MSNKVKIALCGQKGQKFGAAANQFAESETVAVWDPDHEKGRAVSEALNCRLETDYDAILEDPEIRGVVITVPNILHTDILFRTARAGKNIFLEKPLCLDVGEAHAIRDAVKRSGVKFYMSDPFVSASVIYIRDFIRSERLGKLLSVRIRFCSNEHTYQKRSAQSIQEEAMRMGGGMMSGTGGHPLHILHYLLGKPCRAYSVFAYGNELSQRYGWEEYISTVLEYPDEITTVIECGKISPAYLNGIEVCGTKGIITDSGVGDKSGTVRYRLTEEPGENISPKELKAALDRGEWVTVPASKLPSEPDDHIRYWVNMQAYDLPNESVGIDDASNHGVNIDTAVELTEMRAAICESAKTHRAVEL